MLESSHFRKGTALSMALEFCAWLTVSALTACPFLQADLSAAKHPCHPRTNAPPSYPLTKSVQDGLSYATESKIGVKESAQLHAIALPVMSSIPIADTSVEHFRADRLPDGSNLLLRIHVLRI